MAPRLDILKTYKLFIDGKFPRTESGRSHVVTSASGATLAHVCKASRKDLRDAVEAARRAQPGWQAATAYNRGQVLYRMAEMMEGKRAELEAAVEAVGAGKGAKREVACAIDRVVHYAGWADKYSQVLGCHNAVSGPFYNFTIAEPTGVVAVVCPDGPSLLPLVSLLAPVVCAGNAAVVVASPVNPIPGAVLGEVLATSDVPAGVVNILTGDRAELVPFIARHRDIDGIHAAGVPADEAALLRSGAAENIKRVKVIDLPAGRAGAEAHWLDARACESPWWIEPFVEMKTVWHPASA